MIMKIHQSNYKIVGFTESAGIRDLADLDVPRCRYRIRIIGRHVLA